MIEVNILIEMPIFYPISMRYGYKTSVIFHYLSEPNQHHF